MNDFPIVSAEAVDVLNDRQLFAYVWLVRHSERDGEKRVVSVSCRELVNMWNSSLGTVNRTLHSLEGFIVIHKSFSRRECLTIEIVKNPIVGTQLGTQNGTQLGTQKTDPKTLKTKGVQELMEDVFGTQNGTQLGTQLGTQKRNKEKQKKASPTPPYKEKENKQRKEENASLAGCIKEREPDGSLSGTPDAPSESPKAVLDFFNKTIKSYGSIIPPVKLIRGNREGYLNARIREFGIEAVYETITKAAKSDFLNGSKGFVADIDWILRPNNFVKVYEGNYDNREEIKNNRYGHSSIIATNQEERIAEHRRHAAAHVARVLSESGQHQEEMDNSGLPF